MPRRGGDDCGDGCRGTQSGERWRYSCRRGGTGGRAGGLEGRGGVRRECAPLGRHGNPGRLTMLSPHAQPRHQTTTRRLCAKVLDSRVGSERNMPSHAAFARLGAGRHPASLAVMRVGTPFFFWFFFFLHHALSKSPPTPSHNPSPSLIGKALFHVRDTRPRGQEGPNSSTGKKESQRSLCTKFISCKDCNIYKFSLSFFFFA